MAFNSASLGYVHAMAHQLGGFYNLPHGVCNAVLLPAVQEYNSKYVPELFIDVAEAMGIKGGDGDKDAAVKEVLAAIRCCVWLLLTCLPMWAWSLCDDDCHDLLLLTVQFLVDWGHVFMHVQNQHNVCTTTYALRHMQLACT